MKRAVSLVAFSVPRSHRPISHYPGKEERTMKQLGVLTAFLVIFGHTPSGPR